MNILNLDTAFTPIQGNEVHFQKMIFAGGEPHIKIDPSFDTNVPITVTTRIQNFTDLGFLCLAVDALQRLGVKLNTLVIPYFPAARQDRVMIPGEPLSVKVMADMINHLGFEKVLVYDAHSEVTPALLNNCHVISNHAFIAKVFQQIGTAPLLISPDGGALKKIYKVSESLGGKEVIECSKSRDVKTGKLSGFKVYADDLQGKDCLIVDDICDGGGTFIGLAEELKRKNAGKIYLAVSHGIFSKGIDKLDFLAHVYATDAYNTQAHELLTQISLGDGLLSGY